MKVLRELENSSIVKFKGEQLLHTTNKTNQVNRRPPNSSAMWHAQVFVLENNNKVCRVCSVEASVVLLHCVGNTERGESVAFSMCVQDGEVAAVSRVDNENRNSSKHLPLSGRSIRNQNTNLVRQNLKHNSVTRHTAAQVPHKTTADATLPREHRGILNRCPFPFLITTTTTESSRAQAGIKADGGLYFMKKLTCTLFNALT